LGSAGGWSKPKGRGWKDLVPGTGWGVDRLSAGDKRGRFGYYGDQLVL